VPDKPPRLPPRQNRDLPRTVEVPSGRDWSPRSIEWADRLADGGVRTLARVVGPLVRWFFLPRSTGAFFLRVGLVFGGLVWLGSLVGPGSSGVNVVRSPAATVNQRSPVAPPAAVTAAGSVSPVEPRPAGPQAVAQLTDPFAGTAEPGAAAGRSATESVAVSADSPPPAVVPPRIVFPGLAEKLRREFVPVRPGQRLWLVRPLELTFTTDNGSIQPVEIATGTEVDWLRSDVTADEFRIVAGVGAGLEFTLPPHTLAGYVANVPPPGVDVAEQRPATPATAKGRKAKNARAKPARAAVVAREPVTDAERARSLVSLARQLLASGKVDGARQRLETVVDDYHDTEAAAEARDLLHTLPSP
jgi:hypothetical protein